MAQHGKVRAPRVGGLFSWLAPAKPAAGKHRKADAKPADAPRLRTQRANGHARAEIERRADKRPQRAYGQRQTPADDRDSPYGGARNWPASRTRGAAGTPAETRAANAGKHAVSTRAQLAARGPADIRPHPDSGEGARSHVKARGRARRQAAPLPGDALPAQRKRPRKQTARVIPAPVPEQRRSMEGHGNTTPMHAFFRPTNRA